MKHKNAYSTFPVWTFGSETSQMLLQCSPYYWSALLAWSLVWCCHLTFKATGAFCGTHSTGVTLVSKSKCISPRTDSTPERRGSCLVSTVSKIRVCFSPWMSMWNVPSGRIIFPGYSCLSLGVMLFQVIASLWSCGSWHCRWCLYLVGVPVFRLRCTNYFLLGDSTVLMQLSGVFNCNDQHKPVLEPSLSTQTRIMILSLSLARKPSIGSSVSCLQHPHNISYI